MITFQDEKWPEYARDAAAIWPRHWEELSLDRDKISLGVDSGKYEQMEAAGILHIVTARDNGRLVGYFLGFLMVHPHYKDAGLMAVTDIYYLLPEARSGGTGAKLFVAIEKSLKARGVVKAYISCKIHQDHTRLFTRLGWKPTDISFTKYLRK